MRNKSFYKLLKSYVEASAQKGLLIGVWIGMEKCAQAENLADLLALFTDKQNIFVQIKCGSFCETQAILVCCEAI